MWRSVKSLRGSKQNEDKYPSSQQCLEDFYSRDTTNQMFQTANSIDFKTFADYARSERGLSTEEIRALWDPSSIETSLDRLGHFVSLYVWLRMKELKTEEDRKRRLKEEHNQFALHLPEYIAMLPTKHPEKIRDLKWASKKCKLNHLAEKFPCDKIRQYYVNPCFKFQKYGGL